MSRAGLHIRDESRWIPPFEYPLDARPITILAEPLYTVENTPPKTEPVFDTCYFYNNRAGLVEMACYRITEQLIRQLSAIAHLTSASFYYWKQVELDRKQEIWVDMPPLSTEKAVMRARDMGFGEPLAILDPLPEE